MATPKSCGEPRSGTVAVKVELALMSLNVKAPWPGVAQYGESNFLFFALPLCWMAITSFKQDIDLYTMENKPFLFNAEPTRSMPHSQISIQHNPTHTFLAAAQQLLIKSAQPVCEKA